MPGLPGPDVPLLPLKGVRVLDLSRYLPGPLLARVLGDLGADVIKVEAPRGDSLRHVPPHVGTMGAAFGSVNAGKRSVSLDMRSDAGRALLRAMVAEVDVLIESFRPGILARMGLGDDVLAELNPRLVVCSLSGYGQSGPLRDRAGHDLNYVARAGVLGLSGPPGGPPQVPGVQIGDVAGGSLPGVIGVLAALMERAQTGRGRRLDISLTRSAAAMGILAVAGAGAGAVEPRGDGFLTGGAPCYRCYETADGRLLAVGALEPRFFATLCGIVGRPHLAARAYATGEAGEAAADELQAAFRAETLDTWMARFEGHDVCVEPVLRPDEVAAALPDIVRQVDGHTVVGLHVGADLPAPGPPRDLGADGRAACHTLGVDPALIQAAIDAGALDPGTDAPA